MRISAEQENGTEIWAFHSRRINLFQLSLIWQLGQGLLLLQPLYVFVIVFGGLVQWRNWYTFEAEQQIWTSCLWFQIENIKSE